MKPVYIRKFSTVMERNTFLREECPNRALINTMPGHFSLPNGLTLSIYEKAVVFLKHEGRHVVQ